MTHPALLAVALSAGLVALFFAARASLNEMFRFLRSFLPKPLAFGTVALVFFPGTVVHELAHFFAAIALFLRVRELHLVPEWDDTGIKLGHVAYERADFFRGILVGIAPLPAGLLVFWAMYQWGVFPADSWSASLFWGYLVFAVSSTMFSSEQDLKDTIWLIPVVMGVAVLAFLFPEAAAWVWGLAGRAIEGAGASAADTVRGFLEAANRYVYLSLLIHVGIVFVLKLVARFSGR
jgi:flagellar biosynthesis protein FliQ